MPDIDIAKLMAPLGPFERRPSIAVAVSGGSDSLGLGLLLANWAGERGGRLHVLTVDHGLRPEAAAECARVREIFAAIPGCWVETLRWDGEKPARGIQAAARAARYALLAGWCRSQGVLHLAVAHTADDQTETVAMRSAHHSGLAGLAGMAAVRPEGGVRLLRPLLSVPRAAIRAWLADRGQDWLEDPSNELTRFERVRIRQGLDADKTARALGLAGQLGAVRDEFERAAARLLAVGGTVHETGYVSLALKALVEAQGEVQATALRQIILAVSGGDYAPDPDDFLVPLATANAEPASRDRREPGAARPPARTLGGCVLQVLRDRLHVFREAAAIGDPIPVTPGWSGRWDNRFALQVAPGLPQGLDWAVGPLGEGGLRQALDRFGIRFKRHSIPLPARMALPALWQGEHLVAQPHLKVGEGLAARPAPRHTVTTSGFTVAAGRPHTIYSSALC